METGTSTGEFQEQVPAGLHPHIEEFSLLEGGLLYRIQVHLHGAQLNRRQILHRALVVLLFTWLPLLIFSVIGGQALNTRLRVPFLYDYGVNIRFLITLPLLVFAESVIDPRLRQAVRHFVVSGLVNREDLPAFEKLISRTNRIRDSWVTSAALIALVFVPTVLSRGRETLNLGSMTWHTVPTATGEILSWAGWWFALVSVPLYRLMIWRWVWVDIMWTMFLARVVRLKLNCIPTHPDKAGGLGFLMQAQQFFGIISFAASAVIAGSLADELAYQGATVPGIRNMIIGACLVILLISIAPLLVVTKKLFETRERGLFEYASLGCTYVKDFDRKWVRSHPPAGEPLLGTSDIQSLADLSNSFSVISEMKYILLDRELLIAIGIPTIAPMAVLLLAFSPAADVVKAILKLVAG